MDSSILFMYLGFALAAYSVVGNDVIQTLGTFLSSNEDKKWYVLWLYAGGILAAVLIYGFIAYDGDVSYNRLIGAGPDTDYTAANPRYPLPDPMPWYFVLPPLVLLFITRFGIPVSTTFLILTFFAPKELFPMVTKSLLGYVVAFGAAIALYLGISKAIEWKFHQTELKQGTKERAYWTAAQWVSTGFLWTQWLSQDFANIYAYLPRKLEIPELAISLVIILGMLAYIFYQRGGAIQGIVRSKTNTTDIRSATIIDFSYGIILYFFKDLSSIPMSTTWVFIGLLAGREIALRYRFDQKVEKGTLKMVAMDFGKATLGLVVSVILVYLIKILETV
ncbi:MAG: hypothetical protein AAF206_31200 [Bacteroidota bacterium]